MIEFHRHLIPHSLALPPNPKVGVPSTEGRVPRHVFPQPLNSFVQCYVVSSKHCCIPHSALTYSDRECIVSRCLLVLFFFIRANTGAHSKCETGSLCTRVGREKREAMAFLVSGTRHWDFNCYGVGGSVEAFIFDLKADL